MDLIPRVSKLIFIYTKLLKEKKKKDLKTWDGLMTTGKKGDSEGLENGSLEGETQKILEQ